MGVQHRTRRVRLTYEFVKQHRGESSTKANRPALGVSRSGFYEWLRNPVCNRVREDARLARLIRASYVASHGVYGAPRIFLDLREAGETCSKHRVARLMRVHNIRALKGYRVPRYKPSKTSELVPNTLQREFTAEHPNRAWVTDITYIRTWEGWLYLAVVVDLFSRKVIGWATKPTLARELVLDAVLMAIRHRRPRNTLIHSDQGCQYGKRRLEALLSSASSRAQHESTRKLLGQCGSGVLLQQLEERAGQEANLQDTRHCYGRHPRLHRVVLQSNPTAQPHLGGVSPETFEAAARRA